MSKTKTIQLQKNTIVISLPAGDLFALLVSNLAAEFSTNQSVS